jgi:signal peptidase II
MSPREWGLVAVGGALLTDQISKIVLLYALGFATLAPGVRVLATPIVDVVMAWNPGVSFSFLAAHSTVGLIALIAIAAAGIGGLSLWLWRATRLLLAVGLGLVIGGAIGNLVDRLVYGRVADFFDVHAMGRGFFVCNLADVAISLGVLLLLLDVAGESEGPNPSAQRRAE